ncbi:MAG TPA: hypothetical protein VFU46_12820 [Gemmatimonadales bacterium]|nr:hypothetical protein [Gemmatimonadales bacterium]
MFLGHIAFAFAAKRAAPRTSLGVLVAAAQWLDLLWPILLLVGVEHVALDPAGSGFARLAFLDYPISHSLLAVLLWSVAAGLLYTAFRRDVHGAFVVGLLVLSHWVLDFAAHRPDLPLVPGGARVGLGLWRSALATAVVELALFGLGVALYVAATRARNRIGRIALWGFVIFLLLIYAANALGPAPPSGDAVAWGALAGWLLPFWAAWADRHRNATGGGAA